MCRSSRCILMLSVGSMVCHSSLKRCTDSSVHGSMMLRGSYESSSHGWMYNSNIAREVEEVRVLILGGCGFVGRHMTKKLCDQGHDVVCVDNMVSESSLHPSKWMDHLKPVKPFRFLDVDCREFFSESTEQFDMIIHLAAVVGGRLTIGNQPLSVAEDL